MAFAIWGLFPLYLRPLQAVPALQVIAHRVVWSCLLLLTVLLVRGELSELRATLAQPSNLRRLAATATLISLNWLVYVWGVAHGRVLEASLGYFINPLVNVLLGIAVLSERLNRRQWVSVSIAGIAVAYLTLAAAAVPWIALTVAVSFAVYGLIRKIIHVEALPGLPPKRCCSCRSRRAISSGARGKAAVPSDTRASSSTACSPAAGS